MNEVGSYGNIISNLLLRPLALVNIIKVLPRLEDPHGQNAMLSGRAALGGKSDKIFSLPSAVGSNSLHCFAHGTI